MCGFLAKYFCVVEKKMYASQPKRLNDRPAAPLVLLLCMLRGVAAHPVFFCWPYVVEDVLGGSLARLVHQGEEGHACETHSRRPPPESTPKKSMHITKLAT